MSLFHVLEKIYLMYEWYDDVFDEKNTRGTMMVVAVVVVVAL